MMCNHGRCVLLPCAAVLAMMLGVCLAAAQTAPPGVFLLDPDTLLAVRERVMSDAAPYAGALRRLRREAERALQVMPVSVMDKEQLPPSGDRHDYMSVAPYWWPDSVQPMDQPYVRRDGEVNPERELVSDRRNLRLMTSSVHTLALAYWFTGEDGYAEHAAVMLRTWFLDPATRMTPRLEYAQAVKGRNEGRGAGLIETSDFRLVVDGIGLLEGSPVWGPDDREGMRRWFEEYLDWLTASRKGEEESRAKNNHGTWYDVQAVSIALFLGRTDLAVSILDSAKTRRIAAQIEPDGRMPLELRRTKALGYTTMNIRAFMALAALGGRAGVDLWSYATPDGRSIRQAVDWVLPFWTRERMWEYPQIVPFDYKECYPLLAQAWLAFRAPAYLTAARTIREVDVEDDRSRLLYGTAWLTAMPMEDE